MYKICFYVPIAQVEEVKEAMFQKGAGKIGHYSHCSWQILGEGQFMPLKESHAYIGEKEKLEKISEYKVEMVCDENCIEEVLQAFKMTHPYETPAYQILKIENL